MTEEIVVEEDSFLLNRIKNVSLDRNLYSVLGDMREGKTLYECCIEKSKHFHTFRKELRNFENENNLKLLTSDSSGKSKLSYACVKLLEKYEQNR